MRYLIVIVAVFGIVGCTAISDFGGYTFEEKYDTGAAGGAAGGYVPYGGYGGAAGGFEPLAGAGGAAGTAGGAGGTAGQIEPLAGAAGLPKPDAGIEPEPDAGIEPEPDAGTDAGVVEPETMQCQPCEVQEDCEDGFGGESGTCGKITGDELERVCLVQGTGTCPYGLVFRSGTTCLPEPIGCTGYCVPQDGNCETWLDARGY